MLGGRPSDLDIWLPSNLSAGLHTTANFRELISRGPSCHLDTLFVGPAAEEARVVNEADMAGYGDVNNHWVLEMQEDEEDRRDLLPVPRVNFMRSLIPWNGDAQAFFTGIMRTFDLDICMMFVGIMPEDREIRHVILPSHLAARAMNRRVGFPPNPSMNILYWNQMRLETTAPARIRARLEKMYSKYNLLRRYTPEDFMRLNAVLPTESIEAVPLTLDTFMRLVRRSQYNWMPTRDNRLEAVITREALGLAQQVAPDAYQRRIDAFVQQLNASVGWAGTTFRVGE